MESYHPRNTVNYSSPIILLLILLLSFIAATAAPQSPRIPHFNDSEEPSLLAEKIVGAMSDREVLGQILMFGYPGERPDSNILRWISEEGLGGVKIFGWNATNLLILAHTVGTYQKLAISNRFGVPLLIATDQEGGWVRHIKGASSITPGNMALGASKLPLDAWKTGLLLGEELASVGVNMNFAPTVDLFVDPKADVIGPRAFMANPHWTGILGLSFFRGHEQAGIISAAKHFPGHGDTREDSHGTLPVVNASLETLHSRDLIPYQTLIAAGIPAIMVGHLAFPSVTGIATPATLSSTFLTDLLRAEMGFKGVAITDDLFMYGARTDGNPLAEVCFRAIEAGADILLVSHGPTDHRSIHRRLLTGMEDSLFNSRVREAAVRVVTMKARYLKRNDSLSIIPDVNSINLPAPGAKKFFLQQAARSITVVKKGDIPILPEKAGSVLLAGSHAGFLSEGQKRYPEARIWTLEYGANTAEIKRRGGELLREARFFDTVIVLLPDEETGVLLNELESIAEKVVVISILSPIHLNNVPWVRTSLAAYGTGIESFRAAFAALAGDFVPVGKLPIPLNLNP